MEKKAWIKYDNILKRPVFNYNFSSFHFHDGKIAKQIFVKIQNDNKIITLKDGIRIASINKGTSISIKEGKICIITNGYKYTFKKESIENINKLMSYLDENGVEFKEILFIPRYCINFFGRKLIILDDYSSKVWPIHGDLKITLK